MKQIPRGLEVLVKKAAVDAAFKELLLEKRDLAALEIGLELTPAEVLMVRAVPLEQLEEIIARTTVPEEQRRTFLGQAAAAMLAALGLSSGCKQEEQKFGPVTGSLPDRPPPKEGPIKDIKPGGETGIRPDRPDKK